MYEVKTLNKRNRKLCTHLIKNFVNKKENCCFNFKILQALREQLYCFPIHIDLHRRMSQLAAVYVSLAYGRPHRFAAYFGLSCLGLNWLCYTKSFAFFLFDQIVSSTLASCPYWCISSLKVECFLEIINNI